MLEILLLTSSQNLKSNNHKTNTKVVLQQALLQKKTDAPWLFSCSRGWEGYFAQALLQAKTGCSRRDGGGCLT